MRTHVQGTIYLIHFERPYIGVSVRPGNKQQVARHYLGFSENLCARLESHRTGGGANLMRVIRDAEISWELARVWEGDRFLERALKKGKNSPRLCPICRGTGTGISWDVSAASAECTAVVTTTSARIS